MPRSIIIGTLAAFSLVASSALAAPASTGSRSADVQTASMDRYCLVLSDRLWEAWEAWSIANEENISCWAEDIRTAPERCAGEMANVQSTRNHLESLISEYQLKCGS